MSKTLMVKKNEVLEALDEVHSDQTGPARDNLDAIREIKEKVEDIERMLMHDCGEKE